MLASQGYSMRDPGLFDQYLQRHAAHLIRTYPICNAIPWGQSLSVSKTQMSEQIYPAHSWELDLFDGLTFVIDLYLIQVKFWFGHL